MKTVIIISSRGFAVFRHDLLAAPREVRFIGIFADRDVANVTAPYFDEIHVVPCGVADPTPMLYSLIDVQAAQTVVKEILTTADLEDVSLHCYDEQNVLAAAQLRDHFGIKGAKLADVLPYRDKVLMKSKLVEAGIRVPRFGRYPKSFEEIVADVGLPFILKPLDAAAAEGVFCIASFDDFAALPADLGRAYEYEEFIEGTMYSVNIVTRDGRNVFGGVTEYLVNSFDVQAGRVNADINLIDSDPQVARMVSFASRCLDALGRLDGASHLELFRTPSDELIFLEVAARFKGLAGLAAMQRNYGVAFVNLALSIEAGIESRPYDLEPEYCFDGVIPKVRGVIEALSEPELESPVEVTWKVKPGDRIDQSNSLLANGGTFLVWNSDYGALYRDFKRLATYQPITYRASRVLGVPAVAEPEYFEAKLRYETDPYDVYHDLTEGIDSIVVVDARRPAAYEESHVDGAVNLPHHKMSADVLEALDRDVVYVTYGWGPYCNGGTRAAAKLATAGLRVKEMIGGFEYWKRNGYPVAG